MSKCAILEYRGINYNPVVDTYDIGFRMQVYNEQNRLVSNPDSGAVTVPQTVAWLTAMTAMIDEAISRAAEHGITLNRADVNFFAPVFDRLIL